MANTHNRFLGDRSLSPETLMMGYGYDPFLSERSLKPPVFHTSTFVFRSAQDGKAFFELAYGLRQKRPNEEPGLIYSRINNPDLEMLEDRLAIWDQAEASLVFASGMAAISTTLWAYARPGTVIIHSGPVYGGTDFLFKKILPQFGATAIGFLRACLSMQVQGLMPNSPRLFRGFRGLLPQDRLPFAGRIFVRLSSAHRLGQSFYVSN
jgi:methionine-gamma-lyase